MAAKVDIEIDGESYSLDEIPSHDSAIVKAEMERLLGLIDLRALVKDLGRVGKFFRIAYNGVGVAGHEYTEKQIEIHQLEYSTAKLCNDSALTIAQFKNASSKILILLKCTYGYLLEKLEGTALETLSGISKIAEDMGRAALELHEKFDSEGNKVLETLYSTLRVEKNQSSKLEEEEKKQIELESAIEHEKELIKDYQKKEGEAEDRSRKLEQMEEEAISEIGAINITNTLKSLANAFTSYYGFNRAFDTDDDACVRAAKLRQIRIDALNVENAIREKRQEALAKMSSFTAKLKQCTGAEKMAECAVGALHEAGSTLKHLSLVMMQAAMFWKQVQNHCNSLAESEVKSQVEAAMKFSEEKRLKVWTSPSFKVQAIGFYSNWVALKSVCGIYLEKIQETQHNFHGYIAENPTCEESRSILPDLAENFYTELESDQMALKEENLKAQKKMQALLAEEE